MSTHDPYAPDPDRDPGPAPVTGYVTAGSTLLADAPAAHGRRRRLVVVAVAVGLVAVLVVAGVLLVQRLVAGSPDRLVGRVPADAVAYAHVDLRPSAGNLLGLASLARRLEEATGEPVLDTDRFADEVGEGSPAWAEDVQPWLGRQAAAFALAPVPGEEEAADGLSGLVGQAAGVPGEGAALVLVSDREAAAAFVAEHVDTVGPWDGADDTDGAQGWELAEDGSVLALTDDLLVVGTADAVGSVLAGPDTTLADDEGYRELLDALPAAVATAWVDVEAATAGAGPGPIGGIGGPFGSTPAQAAEVAVGLSLSSGAADLTAVSRPADSAASPQRVAPARLADLPGGGLAYLRVPDVGAVLGVTLADLDGTVGEVAPGEPSPSAQLEEALASYGTDVASLTSLLGDLVATADYDPTLAEDNSGLLVRLAVSDEAEAARLLEALSADLPPDSGVDVADGVLSTGSVRLEVADGAFSLRAGTLAEGSVGEDGFGDAFDGLRGEPVLHLDVRALTGALAPLAVSSGTTEEDRRVLEGLAAFDTVAATAERTGDGLDVSRVRIGWGEPLQPLDLQAEVFPPDLDLGGLEDAVAPDEATDLAGPGGTTLDGSGFPEGLDGSGEPGPVTGGAYGDDPALDALHDACGAGDDAACDQLYVTSPLGSEYESFALSCGGRSEEDTYGYCAEG